MKAGNTRKKTTSQRQIDVCSSHSSAVLGRDPSQSSRARRPAQESASCFHTSKGHHIPGAAQIIALQVKCLDAGHKSPRSGRRLLSDFRSLVSLAGRAAPGAPLLVAFESSARWAWHLPVCVGKPRFQVDVKSTSLASMESFEEITASQWNFD